MNQKKILITLLILLISITQVTSFGIAPASYQTNQEQGNYQIRIINNQNQQLNIQINTPLNITAIPNQIIIPPNQTSQIININYNLKTTNTQTHQIQITNTPQTTGTIGTTTTLTHDLIIQKNVEGPKLQLELLTTNFELNQEGQINTRITNQGNTKTTYQLTITNNQNKETIINQIQPNQTITEQIKYTPTKIGDFNITAKLTYQNQTITQTKKQRTGQPKILIQKITIPRYDSQGITQINLDLKNEWNTQRNTTTKITLTNNQNQETITSNTQTTTTLPNQEITKQLFLNTNQIQPGNYQLNIQIINQELTTNHQYGAIITPTSIQIINQQGQILTTPTTQNQTTRNYTNIIITLTIILITYLILKKINLF